jgi:hypothetical protein
VQKVINNIKDERFKAYIVWLPMLQSDNRAAAINRSNEFTDPRVIHYWDGDQETGKTWQKVMDIPRVAWDIYFLYDGVSEWDVEPTKPDFYMHQLRGLPQLFMLNPDTLENKAREMLKK